MDPCCLLLHSFIQAHLLLTMRTVLLILSGFGGLTPLVPAFPLCLFFMCSDTILTPTLRSDCDPCVDCPRLPSVEIFLFLAWSHLMALRVVI